MNQLDTLLRQVEERLAWATPGPYEVKIDKDMIILERLYYSNVASDAKLITHAPSDLRTLLAIVREMRGALEPITSDGNLYLDAFELNEAKKEIASKALTRCESLASGEVV